MRDCGSLFWIIYGITTNLNWMMLITSAQSTVAQVENLNIRARMNWFNMCMMESDGVWKSIRVRRSQIGVYRRAGAKDGKCSAVCSSICNHKPCFSDFTVIQNAVTNTCQCNPNGIFKCTLPNTRCAADDTCQCNQGFAGNATLEGCLDVGFSLPDLPYSTNALKPNIDTMTMSIHHSRHHAAYITNLNKALKGTPDASKAIVTLQENALTNTAVRNNGGGHYNHAFFWQIMTPAATSKTTTPSPQLQALINTSFGNTTNMIALFNAAAAPGPLFGSGWAWICVNQAGDRLIITTTPNQDNPLMKGVSTEIMFPILGLDVWEHAYYLKYQNLRTEYIKNFWNVVNWDVVSRYCLYVITNKSGVAVWS
jgi:superoxide dismutase, Fe-Mn family